MTFRLVVYADREGTRVDKVLSLSACDDAQAVGQMRAEAWRHEAAGESRTLVLSRRTGDGWVEVARVGTRRHA